MLRVRERAYRDRGASVTKFDRHALAAVLTAAAAALAGCEEQGPTRVCVDQTGRRTWDDRCATGGAHGGGGAWYYINAGRARDQGVPGVGDPARGGGFTPETDVSYRGAPTDGVSRGGFGGIGEAVGGHGGGGEGGGE
jgi:hypothetical protein